MNELIYLDAGERAALEALARESKFFASLREAHFSFGRLTAKQYECLRAAMDADNLRAQTVVWWALLLDTPLTVTQAEETYRHKVRIAHPDLGGDSNEAVVLNLAIDAARIFFQKRERNVQ